jgi:class 3 adenylate cyclase
LPALVGESRLALDDLTAQQDAVARVFFHCLNPEILKLYGGSSLLQRSLFNAAMLLLRYAIVVATDGVILPISYLFEVSFIDTLLHELAPVREAGLLYLSSPTDDFLSYARKLQREYRDAPTLFPHIMAPDRVLRSSSLRDVLLALRYRFSASGHIGNAWHADLASDDSVWRKMWPDLERKAGASPATLESRIDSVPQRLDKRAFILPFVRPLLPVKLTPRAITAVNVLLSRAYIESFLYEFHAAILVETPLGDLDCGIPPLEPTAGARWTVSVKRLRNLLENLGLRNAVETGLSLRDLVAIRSSGQFRALSMILQRALLRVGDMARFETLTARARIVHPPLNPTSRVAVADRIARILDACDTSDGQINAMPRTARSRAILLRRSDMPFKLCSVLFLDVSGWTKLQPDQIHSYVENAMPRIAELLAPAQIVNTWGDGIVATFDSATTAATTALEIRDLFRRSTSVDGIAPDLRARISLHLGDVLEMHNPITARRDIFGPAVHLAARLEPTTDPGKVFCTSRFADALGDVKTLAPKAEFVAKVKLPKDFGEVDVYSVRWPNE